VLHKALLAVNRPALCRLEGDLGLLPAVRACYLGHLTRATVVSTTPFSITQYFHSYSVCMLRTPRGILHTLTSQWRSSLLKYFTHRPLETGKTNRVAHARLFSLPSCLRQQSHDRQEGLVFPCSSFSRRISTSWRVSVCGVKFYPPTHTFNLAPLYGKKCENYRVYVQYISNSHTREYLPDELAILLATVLIMWCRISVIGK